MGEIRVTKNYIEASFDDMGEADDYLKLLAESFGLFENDAEDENEDKDMEDKPCM